MSQLLLSNEQYQVLKAFRDGISVTPDQEVINYLVENGLLIPRATDFNYFPGNGVVIGGYVPVSSILVLTEFGKGYLYAYEQRQKEVDSITSMAESAKEQASKASRQSWVAIGISAVALILEYATNHTVINAFFSNLIK